MSWTHAGRPRPVTRTLFSEKKGIEEVLAVSPDRFYAVNTTDGSSYWALSSASGATIYAGAPHGTVVVPKVPTVIDQTAGAYLQSLRENSELNAEEMDRLLLDVPGVSLSLVISNIRRHNYFAEAWDERLGLTGLRIVSHEGLGLSVARLTAQLQLHLGTKVPL
ncbi:hypothetical protein [Arthrobacter sp. M4]|uniref:hypothetical protein n=1 Tax=Arthrobacter sp. M4 TaxID=218160 RepID=UPI001CDCE0F9|nr:hypothetical protein [Arthrobacter sp. M4]MCA4134282.1 hypothetical protein [Arthrobacter sp. M4]